MVPVCKFSFWISNKWTPDSNFKIHEIIHPNTLKDRTQACSWQTFFFSETIKLLYSPPLWLLGHRRSVVQGKREMFKCPRYCCYPRTTVTVFLLLPLKADEHPAQLMASSYCRLRISVMPLSTFRKLGLNDMFGKQRRGKVMPEPSGRWKVKSLEIHSLSQLCFGGGRDDSKWSSRAIFQRTPHGIKRR